MFFYSQHRSSRIIGVHICDFSIFRRLITGFSFVVIVWLMMALMFSIVAFAGNGRDKSIVPRDKMNPLSNVWSGYYYSKKDLQALQENRSENPGFKYVTDGASLWEQKVGVRDKSCANCHGDPSISMGEAGARYPQYFAPLKRLINLEQRINLCRTKYQGAQSFEYESRELLSLTTFVRSQSRNRPVRVKVNGFAKAFFEKGRAFYYQRRGQLDMSCANCHEDNYGKQLRSTLLSQGQANGFPSYRVAWQKVGSLHRRFQGCNKLVRAKPYALGAEYYVNLELYLNWRGTGLEVETPAVRD